jgi:hypothetical protein
MEFEHEAKKNKGEIVCSNPTHTQACSVLCEIVRVPVIAKAAAPNDVYIHVGTLISSGELETETRQFGKCNPANI